MKMNLKKTLLATMLATTTLGVSTGALALSFTDGDFTGALDIGGEITVPASTNEWQWAAGDALDFPNGAVTAMTDNYTKLKITVPSDTPLLVGQTKQATLGKPGAVGLTPQIAFADSKGAAVTIDFSAANADGKGVLTLPMTDTAGTDLGSATLQVRATGVQGFQLAQPTATAADLLSCGADGTSLNMFGAAALPPTTAGIPPTGSAAAAWTSSLGSTKSKAQLLADLQTLAGSSIPDWTDDRPVISCGFGNSALGFVGSYGLGIATGSTIDLSFTNQVQTDTEWKAPLTIAVTYL